MADESIEMLFAKDNAADQPGLSLFHCLMQLQMDFGFMDLFETA